MKRESVHRAVCRRASAALLATSWGASSGCAAATAQHAAEPKPAATAPSLYERVGGVTNIAVLVADVIDRSYASAVLHANPQIAEAHGRYPKAAYNYNATALAVAPSAVSASRWRRWLASGTSAAVGCGGLAFCGRAPSQAPGASVTRM